MYCPNCGTENGDDARFCRSCGRPLAEAAAAPAPVPAPVSTPTPATAPPAPPPTSSYEPYPTAPPPPSAPPPSAWAGGLVGNGPFAPFGAPLAGWWQRVGALLLDSVVLLVPYFIVSSIVGRKATTTGHTLRYSGAQLAVWVVFLVLGAAYFAVLNGTGNGQTIGNRAPGIAVRDLETGAPIGAGRGLLRWFVRTALYLCFLIPGLVNDLLPLWDPRRQTIADKAARSVVIRLR